MSEPVELAKAARANLAAALGALQSSANVPEELMDVAEPIAQAMSVLHRVERSDGANLEGREVALISVRSALELLQKVGARHPAAEPVMETVAASLSKVHALCRYTPPAPPPAATPRSPQSAPIAAPVPQPQGIGAPRPAPELYATLPPQQEPMPQPAQGYVPQPAAQGYDAPRALQAYAPPPAQPPYFPQPAAQAYVPPQPAPQQYASQPAPQQYAAPQYQIMPQPAPEPRATRQPVKTQPAIPQAMARPQPPAAQEPAPQGAGRAAQPSPSQPGARSSGAPGSLKGAPQIDVELGTHSPSNFYKGLGGNDVIEHGGVFVATYKILKIGTQVSLRILLPGDYEFQAGAVVQWTREGGADSAEPGFGARFTQITPEGRQLVYRYTRNREPIFYDDL